jgi:hypothetical protein
MNARKSSWIRREPWRLALIVLLAAPIVVHLPELLGFVDDNPLVSYAGLMTSAEPGWVRGLPEADPNAGFTAQALGHRAATDWLAGQVPWWNSYEGVGVPLAGEMQCAAFSPWTLLHYFANGHLYITIVLQWLAGLGTFVLLSRLGLGLVSATAGGLLYEVNGALAWLTHAPANPILRIPANLNGHSGPT